jgi:hypothetical protein
MNSIYFQLRTKTLLYHASVECVQPSNMKDYYLTGKTRTPNIIFFTQYKADSRASEDRPLRNVYRTRKKLKLLNLGTTKTRNTINDCIQNQQNVSSMLKTKQLSWNNLDMQYGGGYVNYQFHSLLRKLFPYAEGTIIDGTKKNRYDLPEDDIDKMEEVVVWQQHARNLRQLKCFLIK